MQERFETFTILIHRISRNIRKIKNQEMAEYDLRSAHVSCLYYIFVNNGTTATELCEKCEEDKATVSRALNYLEKKGLIAYEERPFRRYKSLIALTEKGRSVGRRITERINGVLDEVGVSLTEEQRCIFYQSLSAISQRLEELSARAEKQSD